MDWRDVLAAAQAVAPRTAALDEVVAEVWPGATVTAVTMLPGGLSSVLHRVDVEGGGSPTLVLRQLLPEFGADPATARREAEVHRAAADAGVPVPVVRWHDPEGDVLGRPALLLDFVAGGPLLAGLTGDRGRRAMAATLHVVAAVPTKGLVHLPRLERLDDVILRFGPHPTSSDVVDVGALERAVEAGSGAFVPGSSLVHMDLHAGNVLWDGTRVTGILDWPGAAIGNPLADEAYLWLDTCLAHGRDVADALQAAVEEARSGPSPTTGERHLWHGVALLRGLPSPDVWGEAYRVMGVDVDGTTIEARFTDLVDDYLGKG